MILELDRSQTDCSDCCETADACESDCNVHESDGVMTDEEEACMKACEDAFLECVDKDDCDVFSTCTGESDATAMLLSEAQSTGKMQETFEIAKGPASNSQPIPHPGRLIKMGIRYGTSVIQTESYLAQWVPMFGDASKYSVEIVSSLDGIDKFDFFFDVLPGSAYSKNEQDLTAAFLDRGGRLVLVGENNNCCATINSHISALLVALNGAVAILQKPSPGNAFTSSDTSSSQMNDLELMHGVKTMAFNAWTPLSVQSDITDVEMVSTVGDIAVADQKLKKGRVTVWADINPMAPGSGAHTPEENKVFFYNLVHQAANNVDLVEKGGDPNNCPDGECSVWGDPHITGFDKAQISLMGTLSMLGLGRPLTKEDGVTAIEIGDVWLVKHPQLHIQGRFNLVKRRENKPFLRAVAIGGPLLENNTLVVGPAHGHVLWNSMEIFKPGQETSFNVQGLLNATSRTDTTLVQDASKKILGVDLELPSGVKMIVNRHSDILGLRISVLGELKGIDGECGNFNGVSEDDTPELIQARIGKGIERKDILFPEVFNPWSEQY